MSADPSFRASDKDREHVVAVLREQMVAGRLTSAEFDERMGSAYAAKTWNDLRDLVGDLPVTLRFADERAVAQPPRPHQVHDGRHRRMPRLMPIALVCFALIVMSERLVFLGPFVVLAAIVTIAVLALGWARRP